MNFNEIVNNIDNLNGIIKNQNEKYEDFFNEKNWSQNFINLDYVIIKNIKNKILQELNTSNLNIINLINVIKNYKYLIENNIQALDLKNNCMYKLNNFIKTKLSKDDKIINYFKIILSNLLNLNEFFQLKQEFYISNTDNDVENLKYLIISNINIFKIYKEFIKDIIKIIKEDSKDLELLKWNEIFENIRENLKNSLFLLLNLENNLYIKDIFEYYNKEINSILYKKFLDNFINYINNYDDRLDFILEIIFNYLQYDKEEFEHFKKNLTKKIYNEILRKDNQTFKIIEFFINVIEFINKKKMFSKLFLNFLNEISKEIQNRHDSLSIIIHFFFYENKKLIENQIELDSENIFYNNDLKNIITKNNSNNNNSILSYLISLFQDDYLILEIYSQELLKKYIENKHLNYDKEKNLINLFFDKIGLYQKSFCMQLLNQIKFCDDINEYLNVEQINEKLTYNLNNNKIKLNNIFFMIEEKNLLKNKMNNQDNNMVINDILKNPFDKINENFKIVKEKKRLILDKENTIVNLKLKINNEFFRIKCNLFQANFILKFTENTEYNLNNIYEEFDLKNKDEKIFLDNIIQFWKKNKIIRIENNIIKLCDKFPNFLNQENNIEFNISMNQNYSQKLFKILDLIIKINGIEDLDNLEVYLNKIRDNKLINELINNKSLLHLYLKKYKNIYLKSKNNN